MDTTILKCGTNESSIVNRQPGGGKLQDVHQSEKRPFGKILAGKKIDE
jgi:hypothetical protein